MVQLMIPLPTASIPSPALRWRASGLLALVGWLCACSSESEAGVHVELMSELSVVAGEALPAGSGVLTVAQLRWTSTEIELLGCPSALGHVERAVQRWLVPEAHAHGNSTPTLSAVPVIVNGVRTEATASSNRIGNLQPPAGRYCSLRYQLGPADSDAVGLTTAPDMRDYSFRLRGAAGPTVDELTEFELFAERVVDVTLPIELELSRTRPEVSLHFRLDPRAWLAELDASAVTTPNGAGAGVLLDAFAAGLSVSVE